MGNSSKKKGRSRQKDNDQKWELTSSHELELFIKRSRFIACVGRASTPSEAKAFIQSKSEPDASHNCWAYLLDGEESMWSDDGEPRGTAGRPILNAVESSGLVNVAVCVVRYFGGIKLGTGGLMRAYGGVTRDCLQRAPKEIRVEALHFRVQATFEDINPVLNVVKSYVKVDSVFGENGVVIDVRVPVIEADVFRRRITDVTKGRARVEKFP